MATANADTETVDGLTWRYTVSDGKATVGEISRDTKGAVTIPLKLGGCPVTSIGRLAFDGCDGLKSVTIPASVTNIGVKAFAVCEGLKSVTIPESVKSIEKAAFLGCSGLTEVMFEGKPPKGLKDVEIGLVLLEDKRSAILVRYPAKYESEWLPVLEECGFSKHEAVR